MKNSDSILIVPVLVNKLHKMTETRRSDHPYNPREVET